MTAVIAIEDPASELAQSLLRAYFADRAITFVGGQYTPKPADPATLREPDGAFLVAWDGGEPIGCGALRRLSPTRFEVKHLYVSPVGRGRGTGAALLAALEARAGELGATEVVLDTNAALEPANRLYTTRGYESVPPYNDNPNATTWFRKPLAADQ
ncbi:GNAT family N-acetyltransferase [Agrococcus sp. HG114]|uniref:GNAT family N-acetyltransferase n=1 Tax=Agrococcus sp. HG114 TaxID=2969757 RepID=UPI00215A32AE|nr:GNAT family N-acetyltransferase [Agrococcus sp. HG114]MCR8671344.1 GNAT family N-acetyltransferase [Agrococcus sp. HG114]